MSKLYPSLPTQIQRYRCRHNLRSLAATAEALGVRYRTLQNWWLGVRMPKGLALAALLDKLKE